MPDVSYWTLAELWYGWWISS